MATTGNTSTEKPGNGELSARLIVALNIAVLACILILPAISIRAANTTVEWGLLTRVGGTHNLLTLGYTGGLGIGPFNIVAIAGLLAVVNAAIALIGAVRSSAKTDQNGE